MHPLLYAMMVVTMRDGMNPRLRVVKVRDDCQSLYSGRTGANSLVADHFRAPCAIVDVVPDANHALSSWVVC